MYSRAFKINGFALRFENVYGPSQAPQHLSGSMLAAFANQARANQPIYLFEDGRQTRDLVYIDDVITATIHAIEAVHQSPAALNVGTGHAVSVKDVAQAILDHYQSNTVVTANGAFREGDIHHGSAATTSISEVLRFVLETPLEHGINKFLNWFDQRNPRVCSPGAAFPQRQGQVRYVS